MLALFSGCNTVSTHNNSVGYLPRNTLVIRNRTSYRLMVLGDEAVREGAERRGAHAGKLLAEVMPQQEHILYSLTSQPHERIELSLLATGRPGCVGIIIARTYHFRLHAGTDAPPILVTIRSTGF